MKPSTLIALLGASEAALSFVDASHLGPPRAPAPGTGKRRSKRQKERAKRKRARKEASR